MVTPSDTSKNTTTTVITTDLYQTLIDELKAATNKEQRLLHQEATINGHIDEAKRSISSSSSSGLQTKKEETQKHLDQIETEASDVAFELHRLQETQAAFMSQLQDMNAENCQTVEPEIKRLHREKMSLRKEADETMSEIAKETSRLQQLDDMAKACLAERVEAEDRSKDWRIELTKGADEPKMIAKQIKDIEKQSTSLRKDTKQLEERIDDLHFSIVDAKRQHKEVDSTRRTVERDIETYTAANDDQEQEARSMEEKVDMSKAQHHALATKRLEAEIALKKCNEDLRHSKTVAALEKRQLDAEKRQYVKKRLAIDTARKGFPQLQSNLQDNRASLATYEKQSLQKQATLDDWKQRLHKQRVGILRHQNIGSDMQNELLTSVDRVEEKEMQIERERGEEKKLGKVIAVKQVQRNVARKRASQLTESVDDVKNQMQLQKLIALNLGKSCVETNKRCREFSTLHDTIKAERDSCTGTIQASEKAMADLKAKVEALEMKLDEAKSESGQNSAVLSKEFDAHESSVLLRDNLRAEKNRIQSLLREKNCHSERQEVQLKKIRARANTLEREVKRIQEQNEKASAAQSLLVEQLHDRNSELQRCYERSSLYQESLEQGEAAIKERKNFIRMLSLQCADLRRKVESSKRTMPDIFMYQERISRFEEDLNAERKNIEELSETMEDPSNIHRARPMEGDDLETDQLIARLGILEHRLHTSQNILLEKEVTLEEISCRCQAIEEQQAKQNQEVTPLIQELTLCRGRANDLSRTLISLMGELRMYQQSNLDLSEDKAAREHALVVSRRALENGTPPIEEAQRFRQLKESQRGDDGEDLFRNDENHRPRPRPRTNAYVPVDGKNAVPFGGAHAPFQACVSAGGHMRHFRAPRVLTIEEMEQANEVCA